MGLKSRFLSLESRLYYDANEKPGKFFTSNQVSGMNDEEEKRQTLV